MRTLEVFQTADGRRFEDEVQAEEWETRLRLTAQANALLHAGASLWDAYRCLGVTVNDGNHEALHGITAKTPLRVRDWPGGYSPAYRIVAITPDGNVMVYGNAVFVEGYGGILTRTELVRCAEETEAPYLAAVA